MTATDQDDSWYPCEVPVNVHHLKISMLLEDAVRCDGNLVYELLGYYPYRGQVVVLDGVPWKVHGIEWTEITWLTCLLPRINRF